MLCCRVPVGVRALADRFKDLFVRQLAGTSYNNLCALLTMYTLGLYSLSATVRACPWSHSVSDLSRALDTFDANRFMRRLRSSVLRRYADTINPHDFCWVIDDTANPKYGKDIFRAGRWRSSQGIYHGQKVMVVALVDINRGIAIPVSYLFAPKKGDPSYETGIKLAYDMMAKLLNEGLPKLPVVADSWFDAVDLMANLEKIGLVFVCELKGRRLARSNPGRNVKWQPLANSLAGCHRHRVHTRFDSENVRRHRQRGKCISQATIQIKRRKTPINAIAVYNRRNSKKAFAYWSSTDRTMSGARIWELSRARWRIEVLFRDLKQNLAFGRLPCAGEKAADLAVCLPFLVVVSLRLDPPELWGLKQHQTIGVMLEKIRESSLEKSLDVLIDNSDPYLTTKLRARRAKERSRRKPVDTVAEAA